METNFKQYPVSHAKKNHCTESQKTIITVCNLQRLLGIMCSLDGNYIRWGGGANLPMRIGIFLLGEHGLAERSSPFWEGIILNNQIRDCSKYMYACKISPAFQNRRGGL